MQKNYLKLLFIILLILFITRLYFTDIAYKSTQYHIANSINWVIENSDNVSPRDSLRYLKKIYNVIDDNKNSNIIHNKIIKLEKEIESENIPMPILDENISLNDNLILYIEDLIQQKENGIDIAKKVESFKDILNKNNNIFNSNDVTTTTKLYTRYLLSQIGIVNTQLFGILSCSESINDISNVYCLTHEIIIASNYYENYVNKDDFTKQNDLLLKYIKSINNKFINDIEVDLLSEIIVCFKLQKIPFSDEIKDVNKQILKYQNSNGSWGIESSSILDKFHHTTLAIMAVAKFREDLRDENVFTY